MAPVILSFSRRRWLLSRIIVSSPASSHPEIGAEQCPFFSRYVHGVALILISPPSIIIALDGASYVVI